MLGFLFFRTAEGSRRTRTSHYIEYYYNRFDYIKGAKGKENYRLILEFCKEDPNKNLKMRSSPTYSRSSKPATSAPGTQPLGARTPPHLLLQHHADEDDTDVEPEPLCLPSCQQRVGRKSSIGRPSAQKYDGVQTTAVVELWIGHVERMKSSTNPFFFFHHQEGSRNTWDAKAICLLGEPQNQ
jgi:hypothetical protein